MKILSSAGAVLAIAMVWAPAYADQQLAQKSACMACHTADKKLLGPAFRDVAKKYAGNADAAGLVETGIRQGGSGKWGAVPMPAQTALSEADVKALAAWILAGAR